MAAKRSGVPADLLASAVERRQVKWLWRDRIPAGMLSLVAGRPGVSKSLFLAYLAAEVSRKGEVIFSNREDPLNEVVRPRLEAAGGNLDRIAFYSPTLPDDIAALRAMVVRRKAKLLVLDPAAAHLSVSIYNDQHVRQALSPLAVMAAETGCAVVFNHHTVKYVSSRSHALQAVGGPAGGLGGASRAVFIFGEDPHDQDQRILAAAKFNLGPSPKAVVWEIEDYEFYDDDDRLVGSTGRLVFVEDNRDINPIALVTANVTGGKIGKPAEKREEAAEWLTNYLCLGPRPRNDIRDDAARVSISWGTLRRAAEDDVEVVSYRDEKNRPAGAKRGLYMWRLPDGHPSLILTGEEDDD